MSFEKLNFPADGPVRGDEGKQSPGRDVRTWLLTLIGTVAGLIVYLLVRDLSDSELAHRLSPFRIPAAVFVVAWTVILAFTLKRVRWQRALGASTVAALIIALTVFGLGEPIQGSAVHGWRIVCACLALAIALPHFQVANDSGAPRFPYPEVHGHAWANVVIWCTACAFVGIAFLLALLLASLFQLIKIEQPMALFDEAWFSLALAGGSFGGAVGILRERDRVVRSLQGVVIAILAVLAPVLGAGLMLFLLALPFSGLSALWDATRSTTPILLCCSIAALVLVNAVIGNSADEELRSRVMRYGAMALGVAMLPLAVIAGISTGVRVHQHGFTPDRLWALVFIGVAASYGLLYLVSLVGWRLSGLRNPLIRQCVKLRWRPRGKTSGKLAGPHPGSCPASRILSRWFPSRCHCPRA